MKTKLLFLSVALTIATSVLASMPTDINKYTQKGIVKVSSNTENLSISVSYLAYTWNSYTSAQYYEVFLRSPSGKLYIIGAASYSLYYFKKTNCFIHDHYVINGAYDFFDLQAVEQGTWKLTLVQSSAGDWYYYYEQPTPPAPSVSMATIYQDCSKNGKSINLANPASGHDYVDLGLSVLWATCNVGAITPEDYGDYFAWGETSPKTSYTWENYKYCNGSSSSLTKYNSQDGKTNLDSEDDAASVNWGGAWRMPTKEEFQELENSCTVTQASNGDLTYTHNNHSITLPRAGTYGANSYDGFDLSRGHYWTNSISSQKTSAQRAGWDTGRFFCYDSDERRCGQSIRPVLPKSAAQSTGTADYTLILYASGCGSANTYACAAGQEVQIYAEPLSEDYMFLHWNDGSTDNPRTITINSNMAYMAEFAERVYYRCNLSCNSSEGSVAITAPIIELTLKDSYSDGWNGASLQVNDGTNTTSYTLSNGSSTTFTIPNNGKDLSLYWQKGSYDNECSFSITYGNKVQNFTSLNSYQSGAQIGTFENKFDAGTAITITATPSDNYVFSQWGDGNTDNPRTLALNSNMTLTAEFAPKPYTITTTATNGVITGGGQYTYGTQVTLLASPNEHCHFIQWSDGVKTNPRTITVVGDATYSAIFSIDQYTISATADHGMVSGTGKYDYGSEIFLAVTPNYGYHFTQWSDGNIDNPRKVKVLADASYTALFEAGQYIITTSGNHGTVTGGGAYAYQQTTTLTAIPDEHYHFVQWSDGVKTNPRTITVVGDATYSAIFLIDQHTLTVTTTDGIVTGSGTYNYGTNVTLTVIPPFCYQFSNWSDGNTDNPRSVIVETDATYNAICEKMQIATGTCGSNLTWMLNLNSGILTISGTGAMPDYTSANQTPWYPYLPYTTFSSIIFEDGITHIGNYAFYGYEELTTISLPNSIETIGNYAFAECQNLEKVTLGAGLQSIGNYAFYNDIRIEEITCLANRTPDVMANTFTNVSLYAWVFVQNEYFHKYEVNMYWNVFVLKTIEAESTSTKNDEVTVVPSTDNATFTWPQNDQAAGYSIEITKDSVVFCTLKFNAIGQLTGIAFAPGRGHTAMVHTANSTGAGWQFTVTGLNQASKYAYTLDALNASQQSIKHYQGEFATDGYTDLLPLPYEGKDGIGSVKFIHNGRLLIERNGNLYNAHGARVK